MRNTHVDRQRVLLIFLFAQRAFLGCFAQKGIKTRSRASAARGTSHHTTKQNVRVDQWLQVVCRAGWSLVRTAIAARWRPPTQQSLHPPLRETLIPETWRRGTLVHSGGDRLTGRDEPHTCCCFAAQENIGRPLCVRCLDQKQGCECKSPENCRHRLSEDVEKIFADPCGAVVPLPPWKNR